MEWRSTITANTTHVWIPEVEEGDGGNYTCELQYGSRLVRRTTQLKVTGRKNLRSSTAGVSACPLDTRCRASGRRDVSTRWRESFTSSTFFFSFGGKQKFCSLIFVSLFVEKFLLLQRFISSTRVSVKATSGEPQPKHLAASVCLLSGHLRPVRVKPNKVPLLHLVTKPHCCVIV